MTTWPRGRPLRILLGMAATSAVVTLLIVSSGDTAASLQFGTARPAWHAISANSPPSRDRTALAYDVASKSVILFGGWNPYTAFTFGDTWQLTHNRFGWTWTQLHPVASPPARANFQMVYDPGVGGIVLFGGFEYTPYGSTEVNDTWLWSHGNWTQLHPTASPPAREDFAMTYDALDREIVLVGGLSQGSIVGDSWAFNGSTWTKLTAPKAMGPREYGALGFDAVDNETILSQGYNKTGGGVSSTFGFRGGTWTALPHARTPTGRALSMTGTLATGQLVMFGGLFSNGTFTNQTYLFSGGLWRLAHPASAPAVRMGGGFVYDPSLRSDLLFGGANSVGYFSDTWDLTG